MADAGQELAGAEADWSTVPASPLMCLRLVLVRQVRALDPPSAAAARYEVDDGAVAGRVHRMPTERRNPWRRAADPIADRSGPHPRVADDPAAPPTPSRNHRPATPRRLALALLRARARASTQPSATRGRPHKGAPSGPRSGPNGEPLYILLRASWHPRSPPPGILDRLGRRPVGRAVGRNEPALTDGAAAEMIVTPVAGWHDRHGLRSCPGGGRGRRPLGVVDT